MIAGEFRTGERGIKMNDEQDRRWPWSLFMQLFATITLYTAIVGALTLMFQCIDFALPDSSDVEINVHDSICWGLAVLMIFFPAYAWGWNSLEAELAEHPEKRGAWLHTCPTYATLLISGSAAARHPAVESPRGKL